jgi:hypothetical protein
MGAFLQAKVRIQILFKIPAMAIGRSFQNKKRTRHGYDMISFCLWHD